MFGEFDGYVVKTQDVDGGDSKRYKTLVAAVKRFEEMCRKVDDAIAEQFYALEQAGKPLPKIEEVAYLRGVSNYGTVVTLKASGKAAEACEAAKAARKAAEEAAKPAPFVSKQVAMAAVDYSSDVPF